MIILFNILRITKKSEKKAKILCGEYVHFILFKQKPIKIKDIGAYGLSTKGMVRFLKKSLNLKISQMREYWGERKEI